MPGPTNIFYLNLLSDWIMFWFVKNGYMTWNSSVNA